MSTRVETDLSVFSTPDRIIEKYPGISGAKLRWWLFKRHTNGLNIAVRKIGGRLLINEAELARWIDAHSG
jgi:hypothetical protein